MKMTKLLSLLLVSVMLLSLALTACTPASDPTTASTTTKSDTPTTKPTEPDPTQPPHTHAYGEWAADTIPTDTAAGTAKRVCTCGDSETMDLPALTDERYIVSDNTATTQAPGTGTYAITLENVTVSFVAATPQLTPVYEDVVTGADFMTALQLAGGEKAKPSTDITVGKFTFGAGCYFESSNGQHFTELAGNVNTQKKRITIVLSGTTNSIRFDARGATGSGAVLTLSKADGTVLYTSDTIPNSTLVENIKINDLQAGTYYLDSSGSCRIGDLFITERLEKSDAVSIEVNPGNTAFLSGRGVSADSLTVQLVYANGRKDTLQAESYAVDMTAVDANVPGKYTVNVTHTETGFSASYDVVVYGVESIRISDHILDSKRVTQLVQKLYLEGSTYDNYANAAVIATCSAPGVEEKMDFLLQEGEYSFAPATKDNPRIVATVKEAICHQAGVTAGYDITILSVSADVNKTHIIVDAAGIVGEGTDHVVTVKTVNDALRLFALLEADDAARKTITLCPGTYYEKVEVAIPNLSIIAKEGSSPEAVVITYDALNGLAAPNGPSYSTDGSATFSLRATATGFYGKGFTLMNYYNNHERYEASKLIAGSGTQAVACLVRADKVIFEDMRFSSYQDTLYADNGRHIYRNCYIEGRTDYIFGDNATAYFEGCTIRSIYGSDEKNGGYVIATKGGSSSAKVEYGYIFNNCVFEGEDAVTAGSVSIARGWDKFMTIMIMNSQISDKFSLEVYGDTGSNKNDRYTKMNADPVAGQLFEFGNTGAGALTQDMINSAVDGLIEKLCTIPSAERAADFADFVKIFAGTNGTFQYAGDWDGKLSEEGEEEESGNRTIILTDFTGKIEGAVGEFKDIEIDATNGKFAENNAEWVQINAGTILRFAAPDGAKITLKLYQGATCYEVKVENGLATVTITENTYIQSIDVVVPVVFDENTTILLNDFTGKIEGTTGEFKGIEIDATNGKFAENGEWVQINAGTVLTFRVAEGAQISAVFYQDATCYEIKVENGIATITITGNTYIKSITVTIRTVPEEPEVIWTLPDFTVYDAQGQSVQLSEFAGKPIIVNFWASWCPPCKAEMPDFQAAYEKYGNQIVFVMVNVATWEYSSDDAAAFLKGAGYTFPVYFDNNAAAITAYQIEAIPQTLFIQANGELLIWLKGMLSAVQLEENIQQLL